MICFRNIQYSYNGNIFSIITIITILYISTIQSIILAQSPQVIFDNYLKNYGERKGLDKVSSLTMSGTVYDSQSNKFYQINYYKRIPGLYRYERIEGSDTTFVCYDGIKGCIGSVPERPAITHLSKLLQSNGKKFTTESLINDYLEIGEKTLLKKVITTDSCQLYELEYSINNTNKYFYIDIVNYFLFREITIDKMQNTQLMVDYGNYKKIQDLYLPFSIKETHTKNGIITDYSLKNYSEIVLNKEIKDALFKCP